MKTTHNSYDESKVAALFHSNPYARMVLEELATMPKQHETVMNELAQQLAKRHRDSPYKFTAMQKKQVMRGNKVVRVEEEEVAHRDLVNLFKKSLVDFGIGSYVDGRRGHPSRFIWEVDSMTIAAQESEPQTGTPVINQQSPAAQYSPLEELMHKAYCHLEDLLYQAFEAGQNAERARNGHER
jgi:hypothetical protein